MKLPDAKNDNFQVILDALLDKDNLFPPVYLHRFSDISPKDLDEFQKIWDFVPVERRRNLLVDLEELEDSDTLMSFDDLAQYALDDVDPQVRTVAIRLLWETSDKKITPILIRMMEKDPDVEVRSAAAALLGNFVYRGEVDEIPANSLVVIEDSLLRVHQGTDNPLVRRRALESLGYSSRPEVTPLIRKAYNSGQVEWIESALIAMGRSLDQVWEKQILNQLDNVSPNIQMAAVQAAGELSLQSAREDLFQILENSEDDDVWAATIWSLSQIGGENVRATLNELLEETEDDDEIAFLEEALENLNFSEEMNDFGFLEIEPDNDPSHLIDLTDEDDNPKGKPKKKH
jgi:HEAT repeat protein